MLNRQKKSEWWREEAYWPETSGSKERHLVGSLYFPFAADPGLSVREGTYQEYQRVQTKYTQPPQNPILSN